MEELLDVAIVGAGVAGLSAALAMQRAQPGASVRVFERDQQMDDRKQGYGLTLRLSPYAPIAKLDIVEEVKKIDSDDGASDCHYVFAGDGRILGYFGHAFVKEGTAATFGQRGNLRVPRQALRQLVAGRLKEDTVQWGKRFHDYEEKDDEVIVWFTDNTCVRTKLLVGADGFRSRVRVKLDEKDLASATSATSGTVATGTAESIGPMNVDALPPPAPHLNYTGVMVVLGITSYPHPLLRQRGFYTIDGTHRLFTMPFTRAQGTANEQGEGQGCQRSMWQLSWWCNEREARQLAQNGSLSLKEEVLGRVKEWHRPVLDMVNSTCPADIWGTPLYDSNPMDSFKAATKGNRRSRVTVIGDALHPMSPFKGQGANQALCDATLLSEWVAKCNSIRTALGCFEREMIQRSSQIVLASREAAFDLHHPEVLHTPQKFSGFDDCQVKPFLELLADRGITADAGARLDDSIGEAAIDFRRGLVSKPLKREQAHADAQHCKVDSKI